MQNIAKLDESMMFNLLFLFVASCSCIYIYIYTLVGPLCISLFILQIGRTEQIQNSLDPQFTTMIETDYVFEEVQKMKFAVYDIDNATTTLADDDYLGAMEATLGEVRREGRGRGEGGEGREERGRRREGYSRSCIHYLRVQ